jgi:hypothetical protein
LRTSTFEALQNYRSSHPQWEAAAGSMDDLNFQPALATWRKARLVLGDGTEFIFRSNLGLDQIPVVLAKMDQTVQEITRSKATPTP